jgi:hypothetical protein
MQMHQPVNKLYNYRFYRGQLLYINLEYMLFGEYINRSAIIDVPTWEKGWVKVIINYAAPVRTVSTFL